MLVNRLQLFNSRVRRLRIVCLQFLFWSCAANAAPAVYWASDPVRPGQTAMVVGHDLGSIARVTISRVNDDSSRTENDDSSRTEATDHAAPVTPIQNNAGSVYLPIPGSLEMGVFKFQIETDHGAVTGYLNRPVLYWGQAVNKSQKAGERELRLFGRSVALGQEGVVAIDPARGGDRILLPFRNGSLWSVSVALPDGLAAGNYRASIWNGRGDAQSWSNSVSFEVREISAFAQKIVSAKQFGARGDGVADDTKAIQNGLDDLAKSGGVLYLPTGRYSLRQPIRIPPGVALRGEDWNKTSLLWPDFATPPEALVKGAHDFAIENISLYASNHMHVISGGFEEEGEQQGNIHIRKVRVRASAYRGHIEPETILSRMLELKDQPPQTVLAKILAFKERRNGAVAIRLQGNDLEISDSDVYSSGSSFLVLNSQDVVLVGNRFYNGRDGWYSLSSSRNVICEQNDFVGADLGASGGGVNTLFSDKGSSENYWVHRNTFALMFGWDREAFTTDGPGGSYYGAIARSDGRSLQTLAACRT